MSSPNSFPNLVWLASSELFIWSTANAPTWLVWQWHSSSPHKWDLEPSSWDVYPGRMRSLISSRRSQHATSCSCAGVGLNDWSLWVLSNLGYYVIPWTKITNRKRQLWWRWKDFHQINMARARSSFAEGLDPAPEKTLLILHDAPPTLQNCPCTWPQNFSMNYDTSFKN